MTNPPAVPYREAVLQYTATVAADLLQARPPTAAADVATPFPPQHAADERIWASGPFHLFDLRAPGDGTYVQNESFFFATGGLGLAATAAFYGARAAGNSRRRREAAADAVPRWMEIAAGELFVGSHGMYMNSAQGLWPWSWDDVVSAEMVGPGRIRFTGQSWNGQVTWILSTDWAELIFIAWVTARGVRHPQLLNGSWWPGYWPGPGPTDGPPALGAGDA